MKGAASWPYRIAKNAVDRGMADVIVADVGGGRIRKVNVAEYKVRIAREVASVLKGIVR